MSTSLIKTLLPVSPYRNALSPLSTAVLDRCRPPRLIRSHARGASTSRDESILVFFNFSYGNDLTQENEKWRFFAAKAPKVKFFVKQRPARHSQSTSIHRRRRSYLASLHQKNCRRYCTGKRVAATLFLVASASLLVPSASLLVTRAAARATE